MDTWGGLFGHFPDTEFERYNVDARGMFMFREARNAGNHRGSVFSCGKLCVRVIRDALEWP